jgi:Bacterial Ig domain
MKSLTRIVLAAAVSAAMCLTIHTAHAQSAIATWYCGPLVDGGGAAPAPFTNNTSAVGVIAGPIMKGSGIGAVTTGDAYGGNDWTNNVPGGSGATDTEANAIAGNHYLTYTVQSASGYALSFSTNYMLVHASSTGPHNVALQYSTDGIDYTDIAGLTIPSGTSSVVWTNDLATDSFLQNVPSTTTNYFRIVNWGATSGAGTWYVYDPLPVSLQSATNVLGTNDFVINGTLTAEENLATWYCGPLVDGGGAAPAPFANNTSAVGVIAGPIMKGSGIGAVTTGDAYGGNDWTNNLPGGSGATDTEANAIAGNHYLTYTIQAATNYNISFYTNYIFVHASSTGPHNVALQYSTDGIDYTDIAGLTIPSGTSSVVWTNDLATNSFLQNVPSTTTNYFRIVNWGATSGAGTWYVYDPLPVSLQSATNVLGTNDFVIAGGVTALLGFGTSGSAPTNVVITPSSNLQTTATPSTYLANAGQTVSLTVSADGSPATNFWYKIDGTTTNLIPWATTSSLTLTNVLGPDSGSYFAVLTNAYGSMTSAVVTLTVLDPAIDIEPSSASGVAYGTIQFAVGATGTQPIGYQWYYSDTNGNIIAPATTLGDGSVVSGATSSLLTLSHWQPGDLTNFVVVVTNVYGAVTSSVASVIPPLNTTALPLTNGVLALWDFDGTQLTNTAANPVCWINPVPFIGVGAASAIGNAYNPGPSPDFAGPPKSYSPYGNTTGAIDPNDAGYDPIYGGYVFTPYGFEQPSPNFSWGTQDYPATNGVNKASGVQFNVSTVGAKNIAVAYDSRVSSTASDYERLQYTTNGTDWIDYPESSTFNGHYGSGNAGYYTFDYNLAGFPGVDNNPNFGVRIVTEWESTATYGIGTTNFWVGTANSYTSGASGNSAAGTVSYDLVAVMGDAITNNDTPPVLGSFNMPVTNGEYHTNMVDTNTLSLAFTASSLQMPASNLTFSVQPLGMITGQGGGPGYPQASLPPSMNPTFSVTNTDSTNFVLNISFPSGNYIPDPVDAAPILVTATDTNGETAATWFLLTVASINQPPTNSLTSLSETNTLANTPLAIPFVVGSAKDGYSSLTYTVASDNNTVVPVGNIVVDDSDPTNPVVTITPAANQVGNALISVTVHDNDPQEPRSTTANIAFVVRPNTNVVAVDYFNYDGGGGSSLDVVGAPYWQHLSGVAGQLQLGYDNDAIVSDGNTENLQAKLIGSPYTASSGTTLYASFTVNMNSASMPLNNGSYFVTFNDGSGDTADVEGCLVAATNGAAPGFYRLGIANGVGATAANAQMFPQDLSPDTTYSVVMALSLSNGLSTLWVSPTNEASASVTDDTQLATTNLYNIANIELRESGANEGTINIGKLMVGTTFNSVFYPPQANPDTYAVVENTTNLLSPLLNDAGSNLRISSVSETDGNGTPTTDGTNVTFIPANDFRGTGTIAYTITDNIGESSSSTITVTVTNRPPLANPDFFNVAPNSANNVLDPLANDVVETPGGTLSLVSVSETDGNGTASISGANVIFTPRADFTGTATIGYTITDNVGGTNSSIINVSVGNLTPIPLNEQISGGNVILTWTNSVFGLQFSTNVAGPYVTIPGATSPYTNFISTNSPTGFFRLVH